jgi:hypothetical protein
MGEYQVRGELKDKLAFAVERSVDESIDDTEAFARRLYPPHMVHSESPLIAVVDAGD